jgi:cytoskeletal protein CcmA (bactofilin family)
MSMFRRTDQARTPSSAPGAAESSASPAAAAAQRRRLTHVAPGTRVEGKLSGATELLIEGQVDGEIQVQAAVVIGAEGVVQGPISAQVVRVGGRVVGSVLATERVEVAPSGVLEGDITAPRVIIAEGAFFKGRVEMREKDKAEKSDKPERAEKPPEQMRSQQKPRPETGR